MKEGVITIKDAGYPPLLKVIPDPPEKMYYRGDISLLQTTCVAMVGSRKATDYGRFVARKMAGRLAENGITVVSGMAQGIDSCSHLGALEAKGKTIAVLGNGLDICFPEGAYNLKKQIEEEGLVLSEYEEGLHGTKFTFPQRNRIISGLSVATIVVEAGMNSGSLITAERANEQNRTVYAVPGNITSVMSIGSNRLIQDGAIPIAVIDDVISDLVTDGLCKKISGPSHVMKQLGKDEKEVYQFLQKRGETNIEGIALALGKHPKDLIPIITILEMKGIVASGLGKIFIAK